MTNKWYPYKDKGSYFRLEDGTLFQAPMNIDGSMDLSDNSIIEVDMEIFRDEALDIINDLKKKEERSKIAKELGSVGGKSTKAKHGKLHYQRLATNMNRRIKARKRLSETRSGRET